MASSIRVRATASGETTEVQALIQHPMDSGFVKDAKGELIPPHFITQLTFEYDGKTVFAADWGGGVSKDPYVKFSFKGGQEGRRVEDQLDRQQGRDRHHHGEDPMKLRSAIYLASAALALAVLTFASALPLGATDKIDPVADAKAFQKFFTDKFPKVKFEDFVNGPYSMNEDLHRQWQEKEQFPPYEFSLEMGKEMFSKPFKNGKSYEDCFPNKGIGIRQNYPYFDEKEGKVVTLELALNRCREANGEPQFSYVRDEMAALTAYMAFTSRGKPMDIKIPNDPRALEAYQNGKEYFYTRRGQLNFSCATCHVQSPGERIRAEILAPALGIMNAMPIYRSEWSGMGTTSRRFTTCNSQIRGVPLNPQDDEYRNVEYYLSYVSNGLPISGPGARP